MLYLDIIFYIMIAKMKQAIKKAVGEKTVKNIRPFFHGVKTWLSALRYGFPARKLKIVGITGTKGKTSTTVLAGRLLNKIGVKTGFISTSSICLGSGEEFLNTYKMTTIDGLLMHKYLRQMVRDGCKSVILEMSSQGLEQNRHIGLTGFDIAVFLNLYPEHLEAHGGLDKYIETKSILFKNLKKSGTFIASAEFEESAKMWSAIPENVKPTINKLLIEQNNNFEIHNNKNGINKSLKIGENVIKTEFFANFELVNLAFAVFIAESVSSIDSSKILVNTKDIGHIPGRMDIVVEKDKYDIMVDYAHEPEGMKQLLQTLAEWKKKGFYDRVVHIVSCDGVGRDDWKKPILGDISYEYADFTIVTTDNYEEGDDPQQIVNILSSNFDKKFNGTKYVKVTNRKDAFSTALEWAGKTFGRSIIVSTGVGVEHGLTQPTGVMEWNEKQAWLDLVAKK